MLPDLQLQDGPLTPRLAKLIHTLEWVRIEEFVAGGCGVGRDPHDRGVLANAFGGGEKIRFAPHEAQRCKERTQAERTNARLKDESGGRNIWVRGHK